ncbi:MAG: lycopene cyclase domain-containing protein [Bacteroidota bacterium]
MKEYTLLSLASACVVALLDRALGTRVLGRPLYWKFLGVMAGFKLLTNGYLTWRPIVIYGEEFHLGVRVLTIPVEDFAFGFSLISLSIILWERLKRGSA